MESGKRLFLLETTLFNSGLYGPIPDIFHCKIGGLSVVLHSAQGSLEIADEHDVVVGAVRPPLIVDSERPWQRLTIVALSPDWIERYNQAPSTDARDQMCRRIEAKARWPRIIDRFANFIFRAV